VDHGVNLGLASLERQAGFLHSVLEGLPGHLDALILLHRPTGGHGGSMALGLRVALLYWLAATALPVTVVGRLTHCLVQLVTPRLDFAVLWIGGGALFVVDWVAFDGEFCHRDLHIIFLALLALCLFDVGHRWHWHGVADLLVVLIAALLNILYFTCGHVKTPAGTPTLAFTEDPSKKVLLEFDDGV